MTALKKPIALDGADIPARRSRRCRLAVAAALMTLLAAGCSSTTSSPKRDPISSTPRQSASVTTNAEVSTPSPGSASASTRHVSAPSGRRYPAAAASLLPACKQALADYVARLPASAHLYPVTGVNFPNSVYVPNGPQNSRSIACNFGVSRQQHPGPSTSVDGIELGLSADGPNDVTITRALEQSAHARKVQSSAGYLFSLESNPPCSAGDCSKAGDCVGATACMGYEVQGEFYVGIAHLSDAAPDRHAAMNGVDYGQVLLDWVNSLSFAGDITAYAR